MRARGYAEYKQGLENAKKVNAEFWHGVKEGVYPSVPVARHLTSCYAPGQVWYVEKVGLLFSASDGNAYFVRGNEGFALHERDCGGELSLSRACGLSGYDLPVTAAMVDAHYADAVRLGKSELDGAESIAKALEIERSVPRHATMAPVRLKRAKRPSEPPKMTPDRPIAAFVRAAEAVSEPPKPRVATVAQNGRKRRSCVVTGRQSNIPWLKVMGEYWKNDKRSESTSQTGLAMAF